MAASVLGEIRRAKSEAKQSMRSPVERVAVTATPLRAAALRAVGLDLCEAGNVADLVVVEGTSEADDVVVELGSAPSKL